MGAASGCIPGAPKPCPCAGPCCQDGIAALPAVGGGDEEAGCWKGCCPHAGGWAWAGCPQGSLFAAGCPDCCHDWPEPLPPYPVGACGCDGELPGIPHGVASCCCDGACDCPQESCADF